MGVRMAESCWQVPFVFGWHLAGAWKGAICSGGGGGIININQRGGYPKDLRVKDNPHNSINDSHSLDRSTNMRPNSEKSCGPSMTSGQEVLNSDQLPFCYFLLCWRGIVDSGETETIIGLVSHEVRILSLTHQGFLECHWWVWLPMPSWFGAKLFDLLASLLCQGRHFVTLRQDVIFFEKKELGCLGHI